MGRRRLSSSGGGGVGDEIADGIGAFTSTFNTMTQAFDKRKDNEYRDTQRQRADQEYERGEAERKQMETFVNMYGSTDQGHIGHVIPEANKLGLFGEGREANGYKVEKGEDGTETIYFNVKNPDGTEAFQPYGTRDKLKSDIINLAAPTSVKHKIVMDEIARTTDPERIARLEVVRQNIESGKYDLKERQAKAPYVAGNAANDSTGKALAVEGARLANTEKAANAPLERREREAKVLQEEYKAKHPTEATPRTPPIRWYAEDGTVISDNAMSQAYANRPMEAEGMSLPQFAASQRISQRQPSATGLSGGGAPAPGQAPWAGRQVNRPAPSATGAGVSAVAPAAPAAASAQAPAQAPKRLAPGTVVNGIPSGTPDGVTDRNGYKIEVRGGVGRIIQ